MHCFDALPRTGYGFQKSNPVERLFWARLPVEFATSYFYFSDKGVVRNMLHKIKYHNGQELAETLGRLFASELLEKDPGFAPGVLVPVPLHPAKRRQRGFNQAELIARGMANAFGAEVRTDIIQRNIFSQSQTKKGRFDRWENVNSIFSLKNANELENNRIVLVDDVITTGATLEACASVLAGIQGIKIAIASIAVARR